MLQQFSSIVECSTELLNRYLHYHKTQMSYLKHSFHPHFKLGSTLSEPNILLIYLKGKTSPPSFFQPHTNYLTQIQMHRKTSTYNNIEEQKTDPNWVLIHSFTPSKNCWPHESRFIFDANSQSTKQHHNKDFL